MNTFDPVPQTTRFTPARNTAITVVLGLFAAAIAGATATQSIPFVLAAVLLVGCAGGIFLLRHPTLLLLALVFTAPFSEHLALNAGGLNVRPYVPMSGLGIAWIVWLLMTREKSRVTEIAWYYKGTLALIVLLLISKCVTVFTQSVMPPFMTPIFCYKIIVFISLQFAASVVVACFIETPEMLHTVIRGWIHISNVVCFVAFIQLVLANALGMNQYVWHREIIAIGRPFSVFREPDVLGCFYASSIALLVPLVVANVKFVSRPYLIITLMVQALSLILCVVRAAWIATAVCMVAYTLAMAAKRRYENLMPYVNGVLAAVLLGIVGMAMAAPSVAEKMIERFVSVSNPKAESGSAYRVMEMRYQFDMVVHPRLSTGGPMTALLGFGDFSWSYWAPYVIPVDEYDQGAKKLAKGEVFVQPGFNMPLAIQFDNGVVGAALYGAFLLALTANFLSTLRRTRDSTRQALLLSTFLPVMAILICYLFSYDPLFLVLWILLGLHFAAAYYVHRAESGIDEIGIPEPA